MSSAVMSETAIGTSCKRSERFVAVTTISVREALGDGLFCASWENAGSSDAMQMAAQQSVTDVIRLMAHPPRILSFATHPSVTTNLAPRGITRRPDQHQPLLGLY